MTERFRWRMRAYYADGVVKTRRNGRKVPPVDVSGQLAYEVGGVTQDALQPDRLVAEARKDIGYVEVYEVRP